MIFVFDPRNARMENRSGFKLRQFLMLFFVLGGCSACVTVLFVQMCGVEEELIPLWKQS